ncbi:MAG: hypothetical protein U1E23_09485 [Reyranellaceae bacterium]
MSAPYREHRIRTSLERYVGERQTTDDELRALVRKARAAGVVVFLHTELERVPVMSRELILAEHRRLCGG